MQRCGDETMKCPGLYHPGHKQEGAAKRKRRQKAEETSLDAPDWNIGGRTSSRSRRLPTGTSGAEQAAGAAAPSTGSSGDKRRRDTRDWIIRDATSRMSRRPPDRINRGQAAA